MKLIPPRPFRETNPFVPVSLWAEKISALLRYWVVGLLMGMVLLGLSPRLLAHGSVVNTGDGCLIQFGFYSAHFTIFQPRERLHREFCEDIPHVAESVFVMEYLHNSLREVPVDFRIIRNETALGRFVKWADVEAIGDLSPLTVFHQQFAPQTEGVLRAIYTFADAGNYVGIVAARHPTEDIVYHAVFPFHVGRLWTAYLPWAVPVVALAFILTRRRTSRKPREYPL